jgi:tetratricopeptide (TPR) repeat protein
MPFRSSAHLLLWAFGVLALVVVCILVIDLGLAGEAAQRWFRDWVHFFKIRYELDSTSIDYALKVLGLAASTVLGTLGFLRILHYADMNLPQRIDDFIKLGDLRHLEIRAALIAPYSTHALTEAPSRKYKDSVWKRVVRFLGLDQTQRALKRLYSNDYDEALDILRRRTRSCETHKGTLLLMRGLDLSVEAAALDAGTEAQQAKDVEALKQFQEVVKLNPTDLDGLEHTAKQLARLKRDGQALQYLKKLARAAVSDEKPVLAARALRFQAEILFQHSTPAEWHRARAALVTATRLLEPLVDSDPKKERAKDIELAADYELLGNVQIKREKFTAAGDVLENADALYQKLSAPEGPSGVTRIEELKKVLARAKRDKEEPDNNDGEEMDQSDLSSDTPEPARDMPKDVSG